MDGYRIRVQKIDEGEVREDVMVFYEKESHSLIEGFANALQEIIPMVMPSLRWQSNCLSRVIVHLSESARLNGGKIDSGLVEAAWKYLKLNDIDPEV